MGRLQNNPSIGWVISKSTHVHPPLAWGNNKENIKQAKKLIAYGTKVLSSLHVLAKWANSHNP
jgi:hypothetical protein